MFNTNLPWDLDHHRYVVLGFPRTGTQLLESFIKYSLSKKYNDIVALQEIFARQSVLIDTIVLENDLIKIHNYSNVNLMQMAAAARQRLEIVQNGDPKQPIVCRVFLDDSLASLSLAEGINYLQNLNFKFIHITRRFDHTMISGIFAWKSFIFNRVKNTETLNIDIDELKNFIVSRYLIGQRQTKLMQQLIPDYYTIDYDDLVGKADGLSPTERQAAFGIFEEKQLPIDPYEQIENAEEVKKVFDEFYPRLQTLAENLLD